MNGLKQKTVNSEVVFMRLWFKNDIFLKAWQKFVKLFHKKNCISEKKK